MDLAQSLVRTVVQSFYETKHVLVVEALIQHSALRDDDLAYLCGFGTQTKELHKVCASLRQDRLIVVHHRAELKLGSTRPIQKQYYFIPYRQMIDAIKYRTYEILKSVQSAFESNKVEKKDFSCPRCMEQYALLDIMDASTDAGFVCPNCGTILMQSGGKDGGAGAETLRKLNDQMSAISILLKEIDEAFVPDQSFDIAWEGHIPVIRDASQGFAPVANTASLPRAVPNAVKGMNNVAAPLAISILDDAELAQGEAQRKAAASLQNVLPSWHTHSTITTNGSSKTSAAIGPKNGAEDRKDQVKTKSATSDGKVKKEEEVEEPSAIDLYYAELAKEQVKEEREAAQVNGDLSDEFEDVDGIGASPLPGNRELPTIKLESPTGTITPASSFATTTVEAPESERAVKRMKLENSNPSLNAANSDSEAEFVDV